MDEQNLNVADTEEVVESADVEQQEPQEEIPAELEGLSEETAREAMAEAKSLATAETGDTAEGETEDSTDPVPYQRFAQVNGRKNELEAKLAEYERRFGNLDQGNNQSQGYQQPQQNYQQTFQQQAPMQMPFNITAETADLLAKATKKRAMQMVNFTDEDIEALEYADDDDTRMSQWKTAQALAQQEIVGNIQREIFNRQQAAREFLAKHEASVRGFQEFRAKEEAEPDFPQINNYAVNDFFFQQPQDEQQIIAEAYARIERNVGSPQDIKTIKDYYKAAKRSYRQSAGQKAAKPRQAQMPRAGKLQGGVNPSGAVSADSLIHMAEETEWNKIPREYRDMLLGIKPIK